MLAPETMEAKVLTRCTVARGKALVSLLIGAMAFGVIALLIVLSKRQQQVEDVPAAGSVDVGVVEQRDFAAGSGAREGDLQSPEPALIDRGGVESLLLPRTEEPTGESTGEAIAGLTGKLVSTDGSPIANGRVWYVPFTPSFADELSQRKELGTKLDGFPVTTTDGSGRFTLLLPEVAVRDETSVFGKWPALVGLADGYAMAAHEIAGSFDSLRDMGDIVLDEGSTARGIVVTESGIRVAGALVTLDFGKASARSERRVELNRPTSWMSAEDFLSQRTDGEGRFVLSGVPFGREIVFIAEASGYSAASLKVAPVERDDALQGLELTLRKGLRLVVSVQDEQGKCIANAQVYATPATTVPQAEFERSRSVYLYLDQARRGSRGVVAERDLIIVDGLLNADYDVLAEASGYEPRRVQVSVTPDAALVTLVLVPEAVSRIRVIDEANQASISTATVHAWTLLRGGSEFTSVKRGIATVPQSLVVESVGDGEFLVHGLGEVETEVCVQAPGYAMRIDTIPGVLSGTTIELMVPLSVAGSIYGSMTTVDGAPLAGVTVRASMKVLADAGINEDRPWLEAVTGPAGTYVLPGAGKGEWSIKATLPRHVAVSDAIAVSQAGDKVEWSRSLPSGATIVGVLRLSNGRVQGGNELSAKLVTRDTVNGASGMTTWQTIRTGANGQFRFADLAPGEWRIGASRGATVRVKAGETKTIEVVWPSPPTIRGRIIADNGEPAVGAAIACQAEGGRFGGVAMTQDVGDYELTLHRRGDYYVQALCLAPAMGFTEMVRVTCEEGQDIQCDLQVGQYRLSGVCVSSVDSAPIAGARVSLEREGFASLSLMSWKSGGEEVTFWPVTDQLGRFELRASPGKYRVRASTEGYATAEIDLDIPAGATGSMLTFVLQPH